jgi:DNA-binding beta-propeller fold protein YncE
MSSNPTRARLGAAALLALSAACATGPKKPPEDIRWPPPPEIARVKFVRAFSNADEMSSGGFRTALRLVVPASPDAIVMQPTGLALSVDEQRLYIACSSVSKVLRADLAKGDLDVIAEEPGHDPASPFGVAVDGDDRLYVSDMLKNEVLVFGPDGKFVRRIAGPQLDKPNAIAIDRRRQLLYVVNGVHGGSQHHRVEVFSLTGEHLRTIGTRGNGPGQFNFPAQLTVGPDGALYVADMLNFRVQVFDAEGEVLGMFGTIGNGQPGTFDKAKAVALDAFGNIYVTDSAQGNVQIFNPKYQVLMSFSGRATAPGFMLLPGAIAIDSKNHIYVADFAAGAVNEFQLVNSTADDSFKPSPVPVPAAAPAPAAPSPGQKPQGGS